MGLFARIKGTAGPKIPVWPFICDFTEVLDGTMALSSLAERHGLEAGEQTEVGEFLTSIGDLITANVTRRLGEGASIETATEDARAYWFSKVWHALARIEFGTMTESAVRELFGLPSQ